MTAIDIDQERESDESSVHHDKSHESDRKYEKYGESEEEGYEAYKFKSNIHSGQQRELNNSYESYGKSNEEGYEEYGKSSLPGENTANRENGNTDEADYDRYEYDGAETPDQEANITSKKSCCKKGRLLH